MPDTCFRPKLKVTMQEMQLILQQSIEKLKQPTGRAVRILILTFNGILILGMVFYVLIGQFTEGFPFPSYFYFFTLMLPPVVINAISLIYNLGVITGRIPRHGRYDRLSILLSVLPFMILIAVNLAGFQNSAIDLMITNFALSYSIIYVGLFTIGRLGIVIWYAVVLVLLIITTTIKGWDYEYHFLTNREALEYQERLAAGDPAALAREEQLWQEGKRHTTRARYVIVWLIFMSFGVFVALSQANLIKRIQWMLPEVIKDIDLARQKSVQMTLILEKEFEMKNGNRHCGKNRQRAYELYVGGYSQK
ncbi:MAG: hypothetical protein HC880_01245 [Bacteroidia bacterium]|nr:hypothetical protein [Bacteroidia bacterium]